MKLQNLRLMGAIIALVGLSMTAIAQGPGGGGGPQEGGFRQGGGMRMGMMGNRQGNFEMLSRTDVQKDLKMTSEQTARVAQIREEMRDEMRGMMQDGAAMGDRVAMQEMMQQLNAKYDRAVLEVLDENQKKRLGEIRIQLMGIRAITDREVQKSLDFTNPQQAKVNSAQRRYQEAMNELMQGMRPPRGGGGAPGEGGQRGGMRGEMSPEMMESIEKINKTFDDELKAIITPEQDAKLKAMGGAEFKADPNANRNRRG